MYLSEDTWRKNGVSSYTNVHFYTAGGNMFPACAKYADALNHLADGKSIQTHFMTELVSVDGAARSAVFKNMKTGDHQTVQFDLLHITPPQSAPESIAASPLSLNASNGFVSVDPFTLQHKQYANVFALGDVSDAPTSKTASAVFSQAPILVHNLMREVAARESPGGKPGSTSQYDGYTGCPVFVGDKKLMLAEFKYGGEPAQTFFSNQELPRKAFYAMKKRLFPYFYWNFATRGLWFGRNMLKKPNFF